MVAGKYTQRGGGFEVSIDASKVSEKLGGFSREFTQTASKIFSRGGVFWEGKMKRRFVPFGAGSPTSLQARTGNLRNTIRYRVSGKRNLNDLALHMIVGDRRTPQAMAQEFGAVITPSRAQALTVPTAAALTPAGVIRGGAVLRRTGRGYETDMGPTFIHRTGGFGGPAYIAVRRPNGQIVVLYTLRQRVVIPGPKTTGGPSRLGGIRTAEEARDRVIEEVQREIVRIWEQGE